MSDLPGDRQGVLVRSVQSTPLRLTPGCPILLLAVAGDAHHPVEVWCHAFVATQLAGP